jgi:5'-nucleotidase
MSDRLTILLTNDDGFDSPGIRSAYKAFSPSYNVLVVAPDQEQSGIGHAFTFNRPVYLEEAADGAFTGWRVKGTPSDCVKLGISHVLRRRPDAVISGINIGENSGISGFYSGTVAAARESAFWRVPGFAFSLEKNGEAHLDRYARQAVEIFERIMPIAANGLSRQTPIYYNVNFPACSPEACAGIRIARQSCAFFDDRYAPSGDKGGLMIYGDKVGIEPSDQFDTRALMNGHITIAPLHVDATAHEAVDKLKSLAITTDRRESNA